MWLTEFLNLPIPQTNQKDSLRTDCGKNMNVTEQTMQAVVMRWVMNEKHHELVLPNSTAFFWWEADLLSVTKAGYSHEFEIKISRADYKRDGKKHKHRFIGMEKNGPNYFWYVTYGFEIEPPERAGWILVSKYPDRNRLVLEVKKEAPRLNNWKVPEKKLLDIARCLSWRMVGEYHRFIDMAERAE